MGRDHDRGGISITKQGALWSYGVCSGSIINSNVINYIGDGIPDPATPPVTPTMVGTGHE
jgi:hypothetical protein